MSSRQLLGLGAVLLAVASAAWYTVGAPARGRGVEPGAATQVALTASATGTGNWVRYLLTVKNVADGTFTGDVLLIDSPENDINGTAQPTISNLNGRQLPAPPQVAAQSAYRVHVTVPSRKSRTITVIAPDSFNYAQVRSGGQVVQDATVDRAPVLPVAVLSDVEAAAEAIDRLRFDRISPRVAAFSAARTFPGTAAQLAGYATVVIDQFDTAALSAAQVGALRDFIGLGGTLVVAGGMTWRRTVTPLPVDLAPILPVATATVSLRAAARLAGSTAGELQAPIAFGSLASRARTLLTTDDGTPLAAELDYGSGRVVQLAFDPAAAPIAATSYASLTWGQAIGRSLVQLPGNVPSATTLLAPDSQFTALLPAAAQARLPAPPLVAAVLILYLLLVGPLNYLLLRRRLRRPALLWVTAPLVALAFTAGFYTVGTNLQGNLQDHELQVIKVGPGQTVNVLEYDRVLFLQRGNHKIGGARNSLVAPLTLDTFRMTGSTCERCTTELRGLPAGEEHVVSGQQPTVDERGVVYGSVRVVASSVTGHWPAGIDAHLSLQGGRIKGRVTNLGREPVTHLTLFSGSADSLRYAEVAASIPAGRSVDVDAQVQPEPTPRRAGSAAALLHATAANGIAGGGQPVLVGFTVPAPSSFTVDGQTPPAAAAAVIEQPVTLESADGQLRDFESKRLASFTGDSSTGFLDVYDVLLPPSTGPLELSYARQFASGVEIYDFAQGTFVKGTSNGSAEDPLVSVTLTPEQVRTGMVRVRLREPRIFQGASFWVDSASPAG